MLTYEDAKELLGTKQRKKLAGNTYLCRMDTVDGQPYAIVFHSTAIVTLYADGRIRLTSGGYRTVTTKGRLSEYGPYSVYQSKGEWYWHTPMGSVPFVDGVEWLVSECQSLTERQEEKALVLSYLKGECPVGVVTDWRKENGLIPA